MNKTEMKNKFLEETRDLITDLYYKFWDDEYSVTEEYDNAVQVGTPEEIQEIEKDRDYWKGECEKLEKNLQALKEHVQTLENAIIKKNKIIDKLING